MPMLLSLFFTLIIAYNIKKKRAPTVFRGEPFVSKEDFL
jgi:hypothetical protein